MRRDIFQAMADPTRWAIIVLIALQAMTPKAISEHFDTKRQAVSKHLRILTGCELVKQEHQEDENPHLPGSKRDMNSNEDYNITKVSISIYNESLERMEKMIEMGFKEGFTMTLNDLDNVLSTLKK